MRIIGSHPAPPQANQGADTLSQFVYYDDAQGRTIAKAHRSLQPDGRRGGSGLPDPKWLLEATEILIPLDEPNHLCPECAPPQQSGSI